MFAWFKKNSCYVAIPWFCPYIRYHAMQTIRCYKLNDVNPAELLRYTGNCCSCQPADNNVIELTKKSWYHWYAFCKFIMSITTIPLPWLQANDKKISIKQNIVFSTHTEESLSDEKNKGKGFPDHPFMLMATNHHITLIHHYYRRVENNDQHKPLVWLWTEIRK